jgi:hypothetical protein
VVRGAPPIEARPEYLLLTNAGCTSAHIRHCRGTIPEEKQCVSLFGDAEVPVHFLLAALFGKAAAAAASKGLAAKASAGAAKSASGHHGHRNLAKKIAKKVVDKVRDDVVDRVAEKADAKRAQRKGALTPAPD